MKNTWRTLNSLLRSSKKTLSRTFVDCNKTFSDSKEIATNLITFSPILARHLMLESNTGVMILIPI